MKMYGLTLYQLLVVIDEFCDSLKFKDSGRLFLLQQDKITDVISKMKEYNWI
jgi:hypothetical protein